MTALLVLGDALAIAAAFSAAYLLRSRGVLAQTLEPLLPLPVYLNALPFAVLLFLACCSLRGLYHPRRRLNRVSEAYEVVKATTVWAMLIMTGSYLVKYDYSRLIVVTTWVFSLGTVTLLRLIANHLIRWLSQRGVGTTRVLLVGTGRPARIVAQELRRYEPLGFAVVGWAGDGSGNGLPLLGSVAEVPQLVARHGVDLVYVADPSLSYEAILNLAYTCPKPDVEFRIAANIFGRFLEPRSLTELEGLPSLNLRRAQPPLLAVGVKRFVDLVLGGLLLVASLPVWAVLTYLIRRDSRGPAVIRQPRIGFRGQRFLMYKFRSMVAEANRDAPPPQTPDDPRVTRLGRFLRRTSLDELPQLLNVIRGEMSLVGPRPELESLAAGYRGWQLRRFDAKPGLTGLWQILGRKDLNLEQKLVYDFYYVNNQSLILDLVILVRTIPQIIFGRGAY